MQLLESQVTSIFSDRRFLLESTEPSRHWAIVRLPNGAKKTIELWSMDSSAVSVFGVLEQARQYMGDFEFVKLMEPIEVMS